MYTMETQTIQLARYLSYRQAAGYLGVSIGTLRRMAESGTVKAYPLGEKLIRFDRCELDALIHTSAKQLIGGQP
jgi:excisionase family DNA binding protein